MTTKNVKIEGLNKKGRTYNHEVVVGDETLQVKTTCKVFGGPFVDTKWQLDGDCLKCKQSKFVQDMCKISAYPEILDYGKKKAVNSGTRKIVKKIDGKKSIKEFVGECINAGTYTRKEIIKMFLENYSEHNENQGGRYLTSAFNAKYAIPRWGKIAKKEANGIIKWA